MLAMASTHAEDADFKIPEREIILAMQTAVRADDKHWFAAHLHLPVRYYGKTYQTIRTKEWFLAHYATVIGPELKAAILAQDPETYLKNYQDSWSAKAAAISGSRTSATRVRAFRRATRSSPSTIPSRSIRE